MFYAWLGWVGGAGRVDLGLDGVVPRRTGLMTVDALLAGNGQVFWNAINHLILPPRCWVFHSLAYISRNDPQLYAGPAVRRSSLLPPG
ncbi:dipeptide transport system permease DppB [Klebsiella pneumoniae]|uniref:Dipeptide transport system permease DppB n=1 Tax=Klebsiella pneumoniae TaxID=573 RepID=A0A4P0YAS8_KLEPN|nr:dipeptide transport system permease DppB [Klebsiella pneumoniae]